MPTHQLELRARWDVEYFAQYDQEPKEPAVGWYWKRWWTEDAQQGLYQYASTSRGIDSSTGGTAGDTGVEVAPDETTFYVLMWDFSAVEHSRINGMPFIVTHPNITEWRYFDESDDWEVTCDAWVSQGPA